MRYDKKYTFVYKYSTRYSCHSFVKLEFSRQIFEKYSNINLHENSLSMSQVFLADKRSEGREHVTKLIVTFRSYANVPKK